MKKILSILLLLIVIPYNVYAEEFNDSNKRVDTTILNTYSRGIDFTNECIESETDNCQYALVKGNIKTYLSIDDIINSFDFEEFNSEYKNYKLTVESTGNSGEIINGSSKLILWKDEIAIQIYTLFIIGDLNDDSIVDESDFNILLTKFKNQPEANLVDNQVDINRDSVFDINDLTYLLNSITQKSWDNSELEESITGKIVQNKEIYIGDNVEVKFILSGLKNKGIICLTGNINYGEEYLQLLSINNESGFNYIANNKFFFIIDTNTLETEEITMSLNLKTKKPGTTSLSLTNFSISMNGKFLKSPSNSSTEIKINNYGTGGDGILEEENNSKQEPTPISNNKIVKVSTTGKSLTNYFPRRNSPQYVSLSTDNYIKELKITDYNLDFDMYKYDYTLKIKKDIKKLDISVILNDEKSSYTIKGNENLKIGDNEIIITVTSESGSTRDYKIKVTKQVSKTKAETLSKESNTTSKKIVIVIIVLIIIGLVFAIFKDDEEENNE